MKRAGFTLLEVMVAVAILGIALTAIFSSEAGAIRASNRARRTNVATLLARCKMAELEEKIARDGFNETDEHGSDACCEGAEFEGFSCDWSLNRIVLPDAPDPSQMSEEEARAGSSRQPAPGEQPFSNGNVDPLHSLTSGANGAPPSVESIMAGGATDALSTLAMQITFPILKTQIEELVRRGTVTVSWREGSSTRSMEATQFMVVAAGAQAPQSDSPPPPPPPPPPPR